MTDTNGAARQGIIGTLIAAGRAAIAYAAAMSLLVLLGWAIDSELLKSLLHPARVAMNPLTAVCFLACAGSLWPGRQGSPSAGQRLAARGLASVPVIVGVICLIGIYGRFDAHIDEWLFHRQLAIRAGRNRIAPATALDFILSGAALICLDARRPILRNAATWLTLASLSVAMLALTTYLYLVGSFYTVARHVPMALNTATCFIALGLATLCLRHDREPARTLISDTAGGVMARRMLPAALALPLGLGWAVMFYLRLAARGTSGDDRTEFALSLLALGIVILFNLLLWWNARSLRRMDEERQRISAALDEAAQSEREAHKALKSAESQMVAREKMAGLGQMVAGVAHEINNPLAFVNNNTAVLRRDLGIVRQVLELYVKGDACLAELRPELREEIRELFERGDLAYTLPNMSDMLDRSREGLKRIQRIVSDLRNFARLDESDLHEVDVNAGIESAANLIRGTAGEKGVELRLNLGQLPQIAVYPAKINQVVMNLMTNAIEACGAGGHVDLSTSALDGHVRIEVTDDGPGVPVAIRDKIFDPFFTTKPPGQGTGLGLSISYGIVQDHGGAIEIGEAPSGGAKFTVRLPVRTFAAAG